jgi:KRAB domain-containing zinc finger protein
MDASEHEAEKSFKCDICGHLFSKKSVMNKHVTSEHEAEKPFKCDICDHIYSQKSVMNKHVASELGLIRT